MTTNASTTFVSRTSVADTPRGGTGTHAPTASLRESTSSKHAIVIGAGFGGLAAALRLRARGFVVTIVERQASIGGRAQVFERDGFRHDAGPTIITAPALIDDLFYLFGKRREDYVKFQPLNPWYRFHFQDGTNFDYGGTVEDTLAEIRRVSPEDSKGYLALLEHSKAVYDIAFEKLSTKPFTSLLTLLAETPRLARLRADRTVWQLVSRHLQSDKLRQVFSIQPLLIGGNPFTTTSIYTLIHFLERKSGVSFAAGGTGALVAALGKLLIEEGVTLRLSTTVKAIEVSGKRATAVCLDNGERLSADIVVSNTDPFHLYGGLVNKTHLRPMTRAKLKSTLSMGLFVLYFGTKAKYDNVAHNTIWLGARYRELLKDVFDRKVLADDFSLYLHRPTATDPSFAPDGCDSFYALCPVPNNSSGIDWRTSAPALRERIIAALDRTILPNLRNTITADFYMTPDDFSERYLSQDGNGFSVAPYFTQSAWFRFHNRSESLSNLYLVGAGTHPGAGIPGVLCSAAIADQLVMQDVLGA